MFMTQLLKSMLTNVRLSAIAAILLACATGRIQSAEASSTAVRAVLFASPTCSHCAYVREEVLPPLVARYGSQLQIAIVSTTTPSGNELFLSACMKYGLMRQSVPLLIVGNTAMVGSKEILWEFWE
jgi:hypothetical protein